MVVVGGGDIARAVREEGALASLVHVGANVGERVLQAEELIGEVLLSVLVFRRWVF